jgi:uncharacterized protein YndB with AHSA1/START domain
MNGELEALGNGQWNLRFTRRLSHPVDTVWKALTEPDHLAAWFPQSIRGDLLTPGASLRFESQYGDFDGRVLTVEPPSLLEFLWGPDTIRFELLPTEGGSVLTLVDSIDELGKAARDAAGWHACLDLLEAELAGTSPAWTSQERWALVHPGYVDAFGAEAATLGPPVT